MTPLNTQANIANKSVCLVLNFSALGTTRKVPKAAVLDPNLDADVDMINTSCLMLDSDELDEIKSKDGELRRWIYSRCLPSPFTNGVYLLPNKMIPEVEAKLKTFATEREALVRVFVEAYPRLVRAARERLKSAFNKNNYPATAIIASYFGFGWDYWTFSTPSTLQDISAEFFAQEEQKARAKWNQAGIEVQMALREAFQGLIAHFSAKLSGIEDGTAKRFHASTLTNLNEFLSTFEARNIAGDAELDSLVKQARKLVSGVIPDQLKAQEGLRASILNGFQKISARMDTLIEDKPNRKITFEDDEPGATGTAA